MANHVQKVTVRTVIGDLGTSAVFPVLFSLFLFNLLAAQGLNNKGDPSERRYIQLVWVSASFLTVLWAVYCVTHKCHSSRVCLVIPLICAVHAAGIAAWGSELLGGFEGRPDELTVAILLDILVLACLAIGLGLFCGLGMYRLRPVRVASDLPNYQEAGERNEEEVARRNMLADEQD